MLSNGRRTYRYPATVPDDSFAVTGFGTADNESITSAAGAGIELNFLAGDRLS